MSNTRKAAGTRAPRSRAKKTEPAAVDLDALLSAEPKRPEDVVPVCLRGDLLAEWNRLKALYDAGPGADDEAMMHERAAKRKLADQMAKVEQEMRAGTIQVRLRALPRRRKSGMPKEQVVWHELVDAHPPRKGKDGKPDPADAQMGVNRTTFLDALVRPSIVEPELSDEQWENFNDRLSDGQFERLFWAAWNLNRSDIDVPFSRAVSTMRRLDAELRRRSASASASNDSTDGSPELSPSTSTTTAGA